MKNELRQGEGGGGIMTKFAALRAKTYSSLTGNNNEDKKTKGKKCMS